VFIGGRVADWAVHRITNRGSLGERAAGLRAGLRAPELTGIPWPVTLDAGSEVFRRCSGNVVAGIAIRSRPIDRAQNLDGGEPRVGGMPVPINASCCRYLGVGSPAAVRVPATFGSRPDSWRNGRQLYLRQGDFGPRPHVEANPPTVGIGGSTSHFLCRAEPEPAPGIPTPAGTGDLAGADSLPFHCLAFRCANRLRSSVLPWLDRAHGMLLIVICCGACFLRVFGCYMKKRRTERPELARTLEGHRAEIRVPHPPNGTPRRAQRGIDRFPGV
jgi:hypothetical protein